MANVPYQLNQDEKEIIEGFANKIGFFGGGGGKLVLTSQRLLFTNRSKNQIKMEMSLANMQKWPRKSEQADKWRICYL